MRRPQALILNKRHIAPAWAVAVVLVWPACAWAQPLLPEGYSVTGQWRKTEGGALAETAGTVTVPLPAVQDVITIRGKCGKGMSGLEFALKDAKGKSIPLGVRSRDLEMYTGEKFPDTYLELIWPGPRGRFFVRPNMDLYRPDRRQELTKNWASLPAASEHIFHIELRRSGETLQFWLDGQFMNEFAVPEPLSQIDFKLAPGAEIRETTAAKAARASSLLPLPIAGYARPRAMADARIKLLPNAALPGELALPAEPGAASIAVGDLGRIPTRSDDLVSFSWRRSAVDRLDEARIFAVPLETYSYAQILCASEVDPARTPSFTARLTRYGNSRGDAMADTLVELPAGDAAPDANTRRVGEVAYGPAEARKTVPLWLVRVPLKNGLIHDLLTTEKSKNPSFGTYRYLEFEVFDPEINAEPDDAFPPPLKPTDRTFWPGPLRSSVHIFAIALERSPASLDVRANTPINVFYASDKPELRATVEAREPGTYKVEWELADIDGKVLPAGASTFALNAAGAKNTVSLPIQVGNGWYAARCRLAKSTGEALVDYRTSFVFLPPDTRKAGFESPHGAWWFHWAHGGEPNIERIGPLLQRAGLRHTNLPESLPEAVTKQYGVTGWAIPWRVTNKPTLEERLADHEQLILKHLSLWPSTDKMMIWWESGGNGAPFPSEIWDQTPPPMEEKAKGPWEYRMEYVTALAKMVRAKFPNLKMQYGNDGASLHIVGELLRRKFPREYIDTIATEDLGQGIIPERGVPDALQSAWYLREAARKLGYKDIPQTAAYEWMNRRSPSIGMKAQAEWHIRDALHARAYGFDTIALGSIHDAGNGYFYSLWGAGGLTRRYPDMEPKPVYAAIATHTQVMDQAKFEREVPTGLVSLYVLEFRRGDQWVYAMWTPRGQREAALQFPAAARRTIIDLYGREKTVATAAVPVSISTAPQYVVSAVRLTGVTPGKASFPDDVVPKAPIVLDPMEKLANWTVQDIPKWMEQKNNLPHGTQGNVEVREVNDPEMGPCLELELKPRAGLWAPTQEIVSLKLNQPVTGSGQNAGLWVKGNGGWGEIKFLVQGEKEAFMAQNITPVIWGGQTAVNFEGWNFMSYPLYKEAKWTGKGSVLALYIGIPQKVLHLTEMTPVPELKIRLKGLSLY